VVTVALKVAKERRVEESEEKFIQNSLAIAIGRKLNHLMPELTPEPD
jgi:hypothetical protein